VLSYLSTNSGNNVRDKTIKIIERLEGTYIKYSKHKSIAQYLLKWVKPHMINVIKNDIPEKELIEILWECKKDIDGLTNQMNLAGELQEYGKLNDPNVKNFVESIKENKDALELLP